MKRILIIDDEAVFREAITRALKPCGYECITEDNPSDGIMRFKKEFFNLVILDIMMDPFDGWDTLIHIGKLMKDVDTPIIMSSAKNLHIEEIIRYGDHISGFIKRPFFDPEFCEVITDFFSWYDPLVDNTKTAQLQGVPLEMGYKWIRLNRQIFALNQMMSVVSPQCIPDESLSDEECMVQRINQVHLMIADKKKQRDELQSLYPVLSMIPHSSISYQS
jgi:two-component system, OmpR family, response regulator